jgi:DUF4097 and DUF4098 domain-containing protein YvlB
MSSNLRRSHLLVAVGSLLTLSAPAWAEPQRSEVTRQFSRTVALPPGQRLQIEHSQGEVTVRAGTNRDVRVEATLRVSAERAQVAEAFIADIEIQVTRDRNGVVVRTAYPTMNRGRSNTSFAVDYTITAPQDAPLTIRNRFGHVSVEGMASRLDADLRNGRMTVTRQRGPALLKTAFGDVVVRDVDGDLGIESMNGAISVDDVRGLVSSKVSFGRSTVRNVAGLSIEGLNHDAFVSEVAGDVEVRTRFGTAQLDHVGGIVHGILQNVKLRGAGFKRGVSLQTVFSPVVIRDVTGPVAIRGSNGSVELGLAQAEDCSDTTVSMQFAPIRILLAEKTGYAISARTRFGTVKTETPLSVVGTIGRGTVTGTIGDAACKVTVVSANGDITLAKGTAPPVKSVR